MNDDPSLPGASVPGECPPGERPPGELVAFATICTEAARRHGDDWPAVEKHIRKCVDALPEDQRLRLAREMDRVLRYVAPHGGAQTH
jgi:hypothetical protein